MIRASLRFQDPQLELLFQQEQAIEMNRIYKNIIAYVLIITASTSFAFGFVRNIQLFAIPCVFTLITGLGFLFMRSNPKYNWIMQYFLCFASRSGSVAPLLLKCLVKDISEETFLIITNTCTLGAFTFVVSSNFTQNIISYCILIGCRSYINFQSKEADGIIVAFSYLFLSVILIINDYNRIVLQRKFFLLERGKTQQYNILDELCHDNILITQFNQDVLKFETILVNQSQIRKTNLTDSNSIIKNLYIAKEKKTLQMVLYEKSLIKTMDTSVKLNYEGICQISRQKINVLIMILHSDQAHRQYVIKIDYQRKLQFQKQSTPFYRTILTKLQKINSFPIQTLLQREVIKNFLLSILHSKKIAYKSIQEELNFSKILNSFTEKNKQINMKYFNQDQMNGDAFLFSCLLYILTRICKIKIIIICQVENEFNIHIQGLCQNSHLMENERFRTIKKLVTDLIGIKKYRIIQEQGNQMWNMSLVY